MFKASDLLRDLPKDDDESLVQILRRFIALTKGTHHLPIRSEDDIELLSVALTELGALGRFPQLIDALKGKSNGGIVEKLSGEIGSIELGIAHSRKTAALRHERDIIIDTLRQRRGQDFGYARLTPEERKQIHEYIDRIREAVEGSKIDERKRNALLDRLSTLSQEVDKAGTKMDGFVAFWVDMGFAFGASARAAKPAFEELKEVLRILYRSRARAEKTSLPPSEDVSALPSPSAQDE